MNSLIHSFKTNQYGGIWLPFDGNRLAFRERLESRLRVVSGDYPGKLEVRADGPHWIGRPLQLSYSHSQDRALLIYSATHFVGVDIESRVRPFHRPAREIAQRYFHPTEVAACAEPEQFLQLWCKKEALAKLTREGLHQTIHQKMDARPSGEMIVPVPVVPDQWIAFVALRAQARSS